jgi:hypothetical protein
LIRQVAVNDSAATSAKMLKAVPKASAKFHWNDRFMGRCSVQKYTDRQNTMNMRSASRWEALLVANWT